MNQSSYSSHPCLCRWEVHACLPWSVYSKSTDVFVWFCPHISICVDVVTASITGRWEGVLTGPLFGVASFMITRSHTRHAVVPRVLLIHPHEPHTKLDCRSLLSWTWGLIHSWFMPDSFTPLLYAIALADKTKELCTAFILMRTSWLPTSASLEALSVLVLVAALILLIHFRATSWTAR